MPETVETDDAPISDAPLSQATIHGDTVYVSGQVPVDPGTGEIVEGGIEEQARQTLENIEAILEAAGSSIDDVLKVTVFLTDVDDFADFNAVYADFMGEPKPARSAIGVADLAIDIDVEIEAIAAL